MLKPHTFLNNQFLKVYIKIKYSYTVCGAVSVHLHKVVGHVLLCDNRAPVVLHQDVCNCMIQVCLGESTSGLDKKKTTHLTKGLIN